MGNCWPCNAFASSSSSFLSSFSSSFSSSSFSSSFSPSFSSSFSSSYSFFFRWLPYSDWQLAPRNGLIWKWIWPPDLFAIVESDVWDILKRIYPSLMALRLSVNGNQVTSVYKLTKNESSFFFFWILFVFALTSLQKRVAIYHSLAIHN